MIQADVSQCNGQGLDHEAGISLHASLRIFIENIYSLHKRWFMHMFLTCLTNVKKTYKPDDIFHYFCCIYLVLWGPLCKQCNSNRLWVKIHIDSVKRMCTYDLWTKIEHRYSTHIWKKCIIYFVQNSFR